MRKMPRMQSVPSKLKKTAVLWENVRIRPNIPESRAYNRKEVINMLQRHGFVFLKPDIGGGGKGVVKLTPAKRGVICQTLNGRRVLPVQRAFKWIEQEIISGRNYMAQQGIQMAQVDERNVDFRVHLQKPQNDWLITGFCAKLAPPGSLVTNRCRGGTPLEASKAVKRISHTVGKKEKTLKKEIYAVSKEIAKTLNRRFTGLKELGVDLTVDRNGKIWIFEVNTSPVIKLFKSLKDKTAYQQINQIRYQMFAKR
jgi:glutathione synthase/RimK-type ligase-like ATP-grasp enzyme